MSETQSTTTAITPHVGNSRGFSLQPSNLQEALNFAKIIANSDLVPKDYKGKMENCLIAVQMGAELGLAPMQAIQNIAVVNGRPALWGDAVLAVCQSAPDFEDIIEDDDGAVATCTVKRKGRSPVVRSFSMEDAKIAGLAGGNVWKNYPRRMRQMRARAFALRDAFADRLKGINVREEVEDYDDQPSPAVAISEPKRIGSSSTVPAPPPTETAPADGVAAAPAVTSAPAPAATPSPSPTAPPPQVQTDVAIVSVDTDATKSGETLYVITTSHGTFVTKNGALAQPLAEIADTDHTATLTWVVGKLKGQEAKVISEVAIDRVPGADDEDEGGAR